MRVPFVDLSAGIRPIRQEFLDAFAGVLDSAYFAGGPTVAAFEQAFATYCETSEAVSVGTGTDALLLALRAMGVGPGDEVITAPNSFFATAEAIALAGATPVFADVRPGTLLLDPAAVERRLTPRTKVIIPVHLFGQCAEIEAFRALAAPRKITILEDSCQAHGATRDGHRAGSLGDAAAFSFYPTKNLGAIGEGGAVTTSSAPIAAAIRSLRDHGQRQKHRHELVGTNARLDALQCAALSVRLRHLEEAIEARRRAARIYQAELAGARGIRLIDEDPRGRAVYHLFVVQVADRDRVQARLKEAEIDTAVHYPYPIHLQAAFASLGHKPGDFPVTERAAEEMVSLPMYPEISPEQVKHVTDTLKKVVS